MNDVFSSAAAAPAAPAAGGPRSGGEIRQRHHGVDDRADGAGHRPSEFYLLSPHGAAGCQRRSVHDDRAVLLYGGAEGRDPRDADSGGHLLPGRRDHGRTVQAGQRLPDRPHRRRPVRPGVRLYRAAGTEVTDVHGHRHCGGAVCRRPDIEISVPDGEAEMGGPVCAPDPSGEPGVLSGAGTEAREAAALAAAGRMAGGGSVSAAGAGQAGLRGTAGHSVGAAGRHQQPMGPAAAGQRDGLSAIPPPKGQKTGAGVEPGGLHAYRRRGADRGRTGEGAYQEIKNRAIGPVFYFSL